MSDSVGSVSVEVVPDARGWSEKLRSQIRNQSVEVKANADTEEANAELDKTARTRTAKIKTDVSQLSQGASKLDQFVGNLGLLPSLAIAAGSALVPLGAALVGVTAAIGAPLLIAGGGATLFGFLAGAAVAQTNKQLKVIDSLQKKLDGATKGTAAYTQAQKDLRDAQRALSPEQTKFQSNISKLTAAFQNFLNGKAGGELLSVVNQGIGLLIKLLPLATPLLIAAGGAFTTLLDDLSNAAGSQGFASFIHQLASQVGPDILVFAHIAGNGIKGVTGLLLALSTAFGGPQGGILHGLERLSAGFANLGSGAGHSKWLKDFVAYFHQVGPQVASTLGSLARAFGHIVAALAPLGPPVLHIIKGIADAFNSIPIPVLTGIAGAAAGLVAFQKLGGFKAASFLGKNLGGGSNPLATILEDAKPVPVIVTNWPPGFGAGVPGGGSTPTPVPIIPKMPGIEVPGFSRVGGILDDLGISRALALGRVGPAALGVTAGDIGNEVITPHALPTPPMPTFKKLNTALGLPDVRPTSTAFDALKAHAQSASRQIDLIGPHTHTTMAGAIGDVNRFQGVLNSIHDQRFKVIADTASAIQSLERLQALRIQDKSFTVYQRNQIIEQGVGPGGGIGRHNPGGSAGGGASTGRGGGASTGQTHVHVHLDDGSGRTLHGVIAEGADQVYQANGAYNRMRAGG